MDNDEIEDHRDILEMLLAMSKDRLAYTFFKTFMRYIRFMGIKRAGVDVLVENYGSANHVNTLFDKQMEKSWGVVLMAYKHGTPEFFRSCFGKEIERILRKTESLCMPARGEKRIVIDFNDC